MAIVVVPYDPDWPRLFIEVRAELEPVLSDLAPVFHHVGSTSVPGLAAKPKIDLHAAFTEQQALPVAIERIKGLPVYTFHGDKYNDQSWAFTSGKGSYGARLYLCTSDNAVLRDRIIFRDYLRAHRERADAYAALKLRLMGEANDDWSYYTGGKTDFVRETLRRARSI
ncbi:GrpB family protein [Rhizobium grahamii]|uniref:GrpB family protein n=1 Tax=Rhizobium grahamii TaxID=1120045 RepID=A0A5Q0C9D7_9HYPH|nr:MULTISPECIES: GrpB family protein [Rhizobium]QFY62062.1 GrpB family protein [Rhizobium grahamii]QRM48759.1 GrpB family protein [Rhizobium sp. BG6]